VRQNDVDDVIALSLPAGVEPTDVGLVRKLNQLTVNQTVAQYTDEVPTAILVRSIEWLYTQDPDEVERFQPSDHCVKCRAGNDQMIAFLKEYPGQWVALGSVRYTEMWAEADDFNDTDWP
jgi:hypothetical protein